MERVCLAVPQPGIQDLQDPHGQKKSRQKKRLTATFLFKQRGLHFCFKSKTVVHKLCTDMSFSEVSS